jgi:hypothetical protein
VAPLALTVFVWIFLMNAMDLLPVDLLPVDRRRRRPGDRHPLHARGADGRPVGHDGAVGHVLLICICLQRQDQGRGRLGARAVLGARSATKWYLARSTS